MKKLIALLFFYCSVYSQDAGYQRTLIHFENTEKYPAELMGVRDWLIDFTSKVPFTLRSHKASPKEDGLFRLFSLRTAKAFSLEIGNSGNFLSFAAPANPQEAQNIQYEGKWSIIAYNPSFDLSKFKPAENEKIFENSLFVYNVSEEQAMARFLNVFVSDKNMSVMKQYIADVEKHAKIKLDIQNAEKISLTDLAKAIYAKTQHYASDVSYQIYIKNKDYKKECASLDRFFQSFNPNVIDSFLRLATPEGKLYFEKPMIALQLANKGFLFADKDPSPIELSFKYLSYKFEYDNKQEPYLKLQFQNVDTKDKEGSFQLENEEKLNKQKFKGFDFKKRTDFKRGGIKEVTLELYKNKYRLLLQVVKEGDYEAEYTVLEENIKYK